MKKFEDKNLINESWQTISFVRSNKILFKSDKCIYIYDTNSMQIIMKRFQDMVHYYKIIGIERTFVKYKDVF